MDGSLWWHECVTRRFPRLFWFGEAAWAALWPMRASFGLRCQGPSLRNMKAFSELRGRFKRPFF